MAASKTYHHRVPGARFIMPNGEEFSFAGGSFTTSREDIQKELDKIANVSSSMVFTTEKPPVSLDEKLVETDLLTSATAAFDSDKKIMGPAQTIPVPVNPDPKPTIAALGISAAEKIAAAREAVTKK